MNVKRDTPIRFTCTVAVGEPTDQVTVMVGTTGALFVEGPKGLTAFLREQEAKELANVILRRTMV